MKYKLFSLFLIAFVSLITLVSACIGDSGNYNGMMSGAYGFGFMWLFGWLFALLVIVALVLLIIWLIKQIQKNK